MSNKISSKSYCIFRLRNCGYNVLCLDTIQYKDWDNRKWSILIDNNGASVILTGLKNGQVHLYDGGRYVDTKLNLNTDSIEILLQYLNDWGIINKHRDYALGPREDESSHDISKNFNTL